MTPLPTLHLRERQPRECRLAPDEVTFLLDRHRAHLDLRPTTRRHRWRVTPAGYVGVVLTPRRRIVLSPKFPLRNLLLFDDGPPDAVAPIDGGTVLDLLADRLAILMADRARAGLHREYRELHHEGPVLVGQLDVARQLRQPPGRKDQLHSRADDFSLQLPCHQVPRTLAGGLAASPLLDAAIRARLSQAVAGYGTIDEVALTPDVVESLRSPRVPAEYRPLADLCAVLAAGLAPGVLDGSTPSPALLLSLERWFEQHLSRTITAAFADHPARVQVQHTVHVGEPDVVARPDVAVGQPDRPRVVVDAKWKRLAASGPDTADLYQILAYAHLLGAPTAMLVYPGRRRWREMTFVHTPVRVQLCFLDVAGTPEQRRRSADRLARGVHRAATAAC